MALYRQWVDFVVCPLDSNRIRSREARLQTDGLIRIDELMVKNPRGYEEFMKSDPKPTLFARTIEFL